MDRQLKQHIERLRGKSCKNIIKAASRNQPFFMDKFAAINIYLYELETGKTLNVPRTINRCSLEGAKPSNSPSSQRQTTF